MDDELLFRSVMRRTTNAEEALLSAWRRAAPENEARYREVAQLLTLTARADAGRSGSQPPAAHEIVLRSSRKEGRGTWPRRSVRAAKRAFAAAALVTLGVALSRYASRPDRTDSFAVQEFVTGPTETATAALSDGTVVRLAPRSRLRVVPGSEARNVILTGRAFFVVAKQNDRPFVVRTAAGDVRVLGTRFELEAHEQDLRLLVVEGRVALTSTGEETRLSAGQLARVIKGTPVPAVTVPDVASLIQWVGDFVAFQETPLADAAREIERQFGVRVDLLDARLAERTITGWFGGWTLEEVMEVVCIIADAKCTIAGGTVTIAPR